MLIEEKRLYNLIVELSCFFLLFYLFDFSYLNVFLYYLVTTKTNSIDVVKQLI